jgi:hypothetical protein
VLSSIFGKQEEFLLCQGRLCEKENWLIFIEVKSIDFEKRENVKKSKYSAV